MHRSLSCRTCYEDGLRRRWREELQSYQAQATPVPVTPISVRQLRALGAGPRTEEPRVTAALLVGAACETE